MFKGGWWMDSHAATLSILQNRFRESVISSLATNHLLAQYNVGHIISFLIKCKFIKESF
ncbi:hypothetical protein HBI24_094320 [Parastagonospora nodorum]|nr:hypothetical protein HBI24_094320 [Parastagonospora nodorum]